MSTPAPKKRRQRERPAWPESRTVTKALGYLPPPDREQLRARAQEEGLTQNEVLRLATIILLQRQVELFDVQRKPVARLQHDPRDIYAAMAHGAAVRAGKLRREHGVHGSAPGLAFELMDMMHAFVGCPPWSRGDDDARDAAFDRARAEAPEHVRARLLLLDDAIGRL